MKNKKLPYINESLYIIMSLYAGSALELTIRLVNIHTFKK